jgi:hypothetical protein
VRIQCYLGPGNGEPAEDVDMVVLLLVDVTAEVGAERKLTRQVTDLGGELSQLT